MTDEGGRMWKLMGLYGNPVAANRELFQRVMALYKGPWLMGGDLNNGFLDKEERF